MRYLQIVETVITYGTLVPVGQYGVIHASKSRCYAYVDPCGTLVPVCQYNVMRLNYLVQFLDVV